MISTQCPGGTWCKKWSIEIHSTLGLEMIKYWMVSNLTILVTRLMLFRKAGWRPVTPCEPSGDIACYVERERLPLNIFLQSKTKGGNDGG